MLSHPHRLLAAFVAFVAVVTLLSAAPSGADASQGLRPASGRAASAITYVEMRETTSLRSDGSGEERVEFLIRNDGASSLTTAEFWFRVGSLQYWGIEAFDEQGSIGHTIVADDEMLQVTLQFRQPVPPGAQYRYTFVINFPGLAEESNGEWTFSWGTQFTVETYVRTVYLPGGAALTSVNPPPDEQTADIVRWTRSDITLFELLLRYTLRSLSDQELAEEYAPSFRLHSAEIYTPMPIELALQHASCYQASGDTETCSTGLLGGDWLNADGSYVDFHGYPGDGLDDANGSHQYYKQKIRNDPDNASVVYARIWRGGGRTVIQYWLYYYYNSWGHQGGLGMGFGLHEGDWEMVQVVLDGNEQPLYAVFAQHLALPAPYLNFNGASKKEWNDLARDTANGDHPIVYVALGSHASYFGPYPYLYAYDHTASETAALLRPAVRLLDEHGADRWVSYQGKWGQPSRALSFLGGPPSPGRQGEKWSSPLSWGESGVSWDEFAGHNRGKVRAYIDAPCNVGLEVLDTGQRFGWVFNEYHEEIPGSEYVVSETGGTRAAILHLTYKVDVSAYIIYTTCPAGGTPSARQSEPRELTVEFYDAGLGELVTARYTLPADWTPEETIGSVALGDPGLQLTVDRDNDGQTDELLPPDEVITGPVVPPQVTGKLLYFPSVLGP